MDIIDRTDQLLDYYRNEYPDRQAGYKFGKKCQDLNVYEILAWMEFTLQHYDDDPDQILNWNDAIERSGKL